MPIRKKGNVEIQSSPRGAQVKQTGYTFYSYDKNSAALYFQFRGQDGQPTDLSKATVHLVMILDDDNGKQFIPGDDEIEVISAIRGTAKYVLPEMLLSYSGKVTGYVYMDFDDGSQSDDGQFTFRIKHSMITHVLPEAGDKYVQDFEDVKERVEQAGDSATKDIEKAKDDAESQIGDYVGEVESAKSDMQESVDQVNKDYEVWKAEQEEQQTTFESDTNKTINGINTKVEKAQTKVSDLEEWVPNADDLATKQYVDESVEGFNETITTQLAQTNEKLNVDSVTLNVPTDFPTLALAFEEIESKFYALRASVYVNIEKGHQISEGISLKSSDYRHVTIQSEDDIVEVADGFTGDFIEGRDCDLPSLSCLIDMKNIGSFGINLNRNANITVHSGAGIINAGYMNVFVNRLSRLYAHEAVFTGATDDGMFVDHVGYVYARNVQLSNSGGNNLRATKGSTVEIASGDLTGAGENGVYAQDGATIIATKDSSYDSSLDISGAGSYGIRAQNACRIVASDMVGSNCTSATIYATDSTTIDAPRSIFSDTTGITITNNSKLNLSQATLENISGTGISVNTSSTISFNDAKCRATGSSAISLDNGSNGSAENANLQENARAVRVNNGSTLDLRDADCSLYTESEGIYVNNGSIVNAIGALGEFNLAPNELTFRGIVFGHS